MRRSLTYFPIMNLVVLGICAAVCGGYLFSDMPPNMKDVILEPEKSVVYGDFYAGGVVFNVSITNDGLLPDSYEIDVETTSGTVIISPPPPVYVGGMDTEEFSVLLNQPWWSIKYGQEDFVVITAQSTTKPNDSDTTTVTVKWKTPLIGFENVDYTIRGEKIIITVGIFNQGDIPALDVTLNATAEGKEIGNATISSIPVNDVSTVVIESEYFGFRSFDVSLRYYETVIKGPDTITKAVSIHKSSNYTSYILGLCIAILIIVPIYAFILSKRKRR